MPRRVAGSVALMVSCLGALPSSPFPLSTGHKVSGHTVTGQTVAGPAAIRPAATSQTVDPPTRLEPGRSIERTLTGNATHRYELTLRQGERAEVSALQRGLDVVIRVAAPDGKVLGEHDDEPRDGRDEHAEVVAAAGGNYTLKVSRWGSSSTVSVSS